MKINIDEVRRNQAQRSDWNRAKFDEIEWTNDAGETLRWPEKVYEDFRFCGMANTDFVNAYLNEKDEVTWTFPAMRTPAPTAKEKAGTS